MSIKDQLTADMKQAMKDREAGKLRLSVIRMVRANIKNVEINDKKELTDDEVLAVLMKEVKMRQDSVEEFQKAGRDELVAYMLSKVKLIAEKTGIAEKGFRVVINTGDDGGQTVKHLHIHIIGGKVLGWPPC